MAVLAVIAAGAYATGEAYKRRDFMPYFLERRSALVSVTERVIQELPGATVVHVVLTGGQGIEVDAHLKVPRGDHGPWPVLITLGGVGTGRRTIDYLGNTGNWIVLALDYPYRGSRESMSHGEFLTVLPEARRAMLDTVPAGMLGLDYLWSRDDVDRQRVVLAGGSFGALFSPALAAADERITAVMILFGAGNLGALIDANLEVAWPIKPLARWIGSLIVSPMEPLKYIHRIAPRPVFMLCGSEDEAMPERCTRALYDRSGEPKTIRWLPLGHVNIRAVEFHEQVLGECVAWLRDIGFLGPDETFGLRGPD